MQVVGKYLTLNLDPKPLNPKLRMYDLDPQGCESQLLALILNWIAVKELNFSYQNMGIGYRV